MLLKDSKDRIARVMFKKEIHKKELDEFDS